MKHLCDTKKLQEIGPENSKFQKSDVLLYLKSLNHESAHLEKDRNKGLLERVQEDLSGDDATNHSSVLELHSI